MEPLVSIICTTYNHSLYIRNALDGFLIQKTSFPFKIIVHDDASTDGTQDILREYEKNYPDLFNIIYQSENQYSKLLEKFQRTNATVTFNNFISPFVNGKYVAVCEGNDYWFDPNKLQMQFDYMEAHPACSCVFHPVVWLDGENGGRVFGTNQHTLGERDFDGTEVLTPRKANISTCTLFYRRDMENEWPRFRKIADVGDLPQYALLASKGYFHYLPNVMGVYRYGHAGSWSAQLKHDREFAVKHTLCTLDWLTEFNIYSKKKFEVAVGRTMLHQILNQIAKHNALDEIPWLKSIVIEAHGREDKLLALENLAKKAKAMEQKRKDAEKEYWKWFVKAIGEGVKNQPY